MCAVIPLILFSLKWQCGVFSIQWQAVFPTLLLLPVKWLCLLAGLGNGVTLGSLSLLSSSSYPAAADNCSLWKSSGTPTVKQPNQHQATDKGSLTFSGRQKRNSEWMLMLLYICWMCTVNGQSEHVHQKSITGVKIHAVSQQRQLKLHYFFLALRKKMTWLKKDKLYISKWCCKLRVASHTQAPGDAACWNQTALQIIAEHMYDRWLPRELARDQWSLLAALHGWLNVLAMQIPVITWITRMSTSTEICGGFLPL